MIKTLDVKRIIRELGGPKKLAELHDGIAEHNGLRRLSVNTIHSWIRTNKIQWGRLPELFAIADILDVDLDIRKFKKCEIDNDSREVN